MSYFLYNDIIEIDQPFLLEGEEAKHIIQSRRIRRGEKIAIQDSQLQRYATRVEKIERNKLLLLPFQEIPTPQESPYKIHLYQALSKEKALDNLIQKTTELGITSIVLFPSQYSPALTKSPGNRQQRWNKIALEACKQSGRTTPPEIQLWDHFHEMLQEKTVLHTQDTWLLHPNEKEKQTFRKPTNQEINLLIGPEGGFSEEEIQNMPFKTVQLGPRTLRSDTAAITAVGILQFLYGDLNR